MIIFIRDGEMMKSEPCLDAQAYEIKIFKSLLRQKWKSQKETQKIRLMMKVSETIFWVQ